MKYPFDIVSCYSRAKDHSTKTLSVEARFVERTDEDDSPLKIFKDGLSRFVLTIIDKQVATCNIPLEKLEEMKTLTEYAINKFYDRKFLSVPTNSNNTSPAFTVHFVSGSLKGKSPAEVLIENKDDPEKGRKILNDQYKWLKDNLSKYPNNKDIMDAIVDASKLDLDSLYESNVPASVASVIPILDLTCRPLLRKRKENGMCPCYECKITWDCSRNYPVTIQVKNYLAPVTQKEDKTINVQISGKDKDSEITNTFNMGTDEWLNTLKEMDDAKTIYKMLKMSGALKKAEAADAENRNAAKNAPAEN